jgi:effector-binding domain-containing protein
METTYKKIDAFIAAYQLEHNGRSWESYVSDPSTTPEDELITEVYVPVK